MNTNEKTELAVSVSDKYVSIQTCDEGYDYSIYSMSFDLLDGGIIESPEIPIQEALDDIVEELAMLPIYAAPIDYAVLREKVEAAEEQDTVDGIVASFRYKTALHFDTIVGMDVEGVEDEIRHVLDDVVQESGYLISPHDVVLTGKRARGLENVHDPIDVVVTHGTTSLSEEELTEVLNERNLKLDDLPIRIHPVEAQHLATHLLVEETKLAREMRQAFAYHKAHEKEETEITIRPSIVQALKDTEKSPENKKKNQTPKREER
ncbi:DNA repair protein [Listeria weihenstephanensis FSL R9-0317]|uniref:Large polyvalent protein-associated domain-containing protein n=1 Tax=Listeria weihenstephanensis TaxID=1006155 RepID=A0A1S7FW54_9LIST|nr:LPD16 domain-containing protein [Listeria weihenstephanensis]AQY51565.1 hypothetical protein UE46_11330 [Listeria weihenstephanensis]EUJ40621.1 DNA repair protein [Listeria weihenstephanensis FSL R9-0317]